MRQTPIVTSRLRLGGLQMPSWLSASLVNQVRAISDRFGGQGPSEVSLGDIDGGEEESEYEEIEHLNTYANMNSGKHVSDSESFCALCGCPNPMVRCDMCNHQIFCGACNDMFHRHPKRQNHKRQLLDSIEFRPPLPPKIFPQESPIPPPRRNKRWDGQMRSNNASPLPGRRSSGSGFNPMGSLKRFMGMGSSSRQVINQSSSRVGPPQPMNPQPYLVSSGSFVKTRRPIQCGPPGPGLFQQQQMNRTIDNRRQSAPFSCWTSQSPPLQRSVGKRSGSTPYPGYDMTNEDFDGIPVTVMELGHRQQRQRIPSLSDGFSKFQAQKYCLPPSRDSGWEEDDDEILPRNQRAFSVSACNLQHFPRSNSDASHFATLQRRGSEKPAPPVPPRISSSQFMQPSTSAFDLNRTGAFVPWTHHQQFQPPNTQFFGYRDQSMHGASSDINVSQAHHQPHYGNQQMSMRHEWTPATPPPVPPPLVQRPPTPKKAPASLPIPPTPSQKPQPKPEPVYYSSGNDIVQTSQEVIELGTLSENPEGPWTCEHCTFINPKSSRICTICCKTPVSGYKTMSSKRPGTPSMPYTGQSRTVDYIDNDLSPVIQSKLCFSNSKTQPPQKINLSIEKVRRVPLPGDSYEGESDDEESGSESSSEKVMTEKRRPHVKESKMNLKEDLQESKRSSRASSQTRQSGKCVKQMVDSGTGDYSVFEAVVRPSPKEFEKTRSRNVSGMSSVQTQSSKGTSPPPQTISTQTYEELPISKSRQQSMSKTSLQSSIISRESSPPQRVIEMSDKALRYARRAQQHTQLKRSMSAHLSSGMTSGNGGGDGWSSGNSQRQQNYEGRHLHRSISRQSLASDTQSLPISAPPSRDISPPLSARSRRNEDIGRYGPDLPVPWDRFPTPAEYFASMEDLVARKYREPVKSQEYELSRLLKEAEDLNYTPEDLQVALRMCGGDRNPIKWLDENWSNMIETVQTLATKFGRDKGLDLNEIGTISIPEAKFALRTHKGNVWAAVTECVEQRRKKFLELQSRGTFLREDILTALTANQGNLDAAYVELSKAQLRPFLMRIWGPPSGKDNESVPPPLPQTPTEDISKNQGKADGSGAVVVETPILKPEIEILEAESSVVVESDGKPKLAPTNLVEDRKDSVKNDGDDETFYDLEPHQSPNSISDEDVFDDESNVSNFIQNFQVLPPREISPEIILEKKLPSKESLNPKLENEKRFEESKLDDSNQSLETLTRAVNVIVGKLDVLLLKTQNLPSSTEDSTSFSLNNNQDKHGQEIGKLDFKINESRHENMTSESTSSIPIISNYKTKSEVSSNPNPGEVQLYSSPKNQEQSSIYPQATAQGQIEKVNELSSFESSSPQQEEKESLPSSSTKFYEVLGSLAGSLFGGSLRSKTILNPLKKSEEDVYETVVAIPTIKNQILAEMLQEKLEAQAASKLNDIKAEVKVEEPQYFNIPSPHQRRSPFEPPHEPDTDDFEDFVNIIDENESLGEEVPESDLGEYSNDEIPDASDDDELDIPFIDYDVQNERMSQMSEPLGEVMSEPELPPHLEIIQPDLEIIQPEETPVQRLLRTWRLDSLEKAELAIKLIDMNFSEEDSIYAATECSSLYSAISFLQQECHLCAGKFSVKNMVSMLACKHSCCRTCASEYFLVQVRDHSILEMTCPFCHEPSSLTEDSGEATNYFSHLEILLKDLLNEHHFEMFGRKLRDWTLAKTPNFKWCSKCSSGFITEPLQTHLVCPDCNSVTCAICLEPWDKINHEHRDRARTQIFCDEATPIQIKSILQLLNENDVQCPKCHFKFSLARGGCMHMTCSQCRWEFCSGCSAPFAMGLRCKEDSPFCGKLGLHAHHPRNCLFYLRDKEAPVLVQLLKDSKINFVDFDLILVSPPNPTTKCTVSLQKETLEGFEDGICGHEVLANCPEPICLNHYIEYLSVLVWENKLDPIPILTNDDLETIVRRACKKMPPRSFGTTETDYRPLLLKVIADEIPL